jgi:hypothetical protein
MTVPSRLTFWRSILSVSALLPFLAIWDFLDLANELDVAVLSSRSWMGALSILGIGGLAALLALSSTRFRARERTLSLLELPARVRWLGFLFFALSLMGYTIVFTIPASRDLLGGLGWVRLLVFWTLAFWGCTA